MFEDQKRKAKAGVESLTEDNRAEASSAKGGVKIVVSLMVAGLVGAFLLPVAIDEIVAVDTTSWSSGASSLWDILDIIIVLALFLFFVGLALKRL